MQKLNNLMRGTEKLSIYDKQVVFIFDECHRSQFGEAQKNLQKKFKKYYQFGFTGTPIFPENASGAETTAASSDVSCIPTSSPMPSVMKRCSSSRSTTTTCARSLRPSSRRKMRKNSVPQRIRKPCCTRTASGKSPNTFSGILTLNPPCPHRRKRVQCHVRRQQRRCCQGLLRGIQNPAARSRAIEAPEGCYDLFLCRK
ncbi:DEAD/DEAH box helicase family protein [Rubritalea tangerina]